VTAPRRVARITVVTALTVSYIATVVVAPDGVWIAAGLLVSAGMYAAGRVHQWRADSAVIEAQVRARTQAVMEQLTHLERYVAERGEVDHLAVVDPPPVRRHWRDNGAGYRPDHSDLYRLPNSTSGGLLNRQPSDQ
jgi:hypothetical protein